MIGKIAFSAALALNPVAGAFDDPLGWVRGVGDPPGIAHRPGEQPYFKLPFPCGQTWGASTYDGHWPNRNSLDMFHKSGETMGAPLLAPATGVVEYSGWWSPKSGWTLIIDHGRGWKTYFLHLREKSLVAEGQKVMQGQHVAYVGNSGSDNGPYVPHLHYTVMAEDDGMQAVFSGQPVNPPATLVSRNCGSSMDGDALADLVWVKDDDVLVYPSLQGDGVSVGKRWGDPARVRLTDLDGDGRKDVVLLSEDGSGRAPELNRDIKSRIGDPSRVYFADLDGDRRDEHITLTPDGRILAWVGDEPLEMGLGPGDPARVRFTDLDGDGKDDLAFIDEDGRIRAYFNRGFTYPDPPAYVASGQTDPARVRFADVDGNGRDELIVFKPSGDVLSYWNKGSGAFEEQPDTVLTGRPSYESLLLG